MLTSMLNDEGASSEKRDPSRNKELVSEKEDPNAVQKEVENAESQVADGMSKLQITNNVTNTNEESTSPVRPADPSPQDRERKPERRKRKLLRWVVRIRGLAWNATVEDLRKFFEESNILTIHVVPGNHGRTSGEAMVEVASEEDLEACMKKNNTMLNKRPVELSVGSPRELDRSLGRSPLPQVPCNPMSFVIRMRGVPYTATVEDIEGFFGDDLHPLAIHIPKDEFGRPSGDAFVEFEDNNDGIAATYKHKETLGSRYIEIFQSTIKELCQAMGVATKSKYAKRWVKMQGLPYNTQLRSILNFFATVKVFPIRLARRSDGSQVYAEFSCATDVNNVMKLQQRYIGHRYVELFPCDTNEVEQVTGKKFSPTSLAFKKPSMKQMYPSPPGRLPNPTRRGQFDMPPNFPRSVPDRMFMNPGQRPSYPAVPDQRHHFSPVSPMGNY